MLTITYIIFNLPFCALVLAYCIAIFSGNKLNYAEKMQLTEEQKVLVNNLTFTHTVNLNSMVNAIIYLVRIKDLKKFGRTVVSRISRKQISTRQETSLKEIGRVTESTLDRLDGLKRAEGTVLENKTVSRVRNDTEHSSYESEDSTCYKRVRADNASPGLMSRVRTSSEGSRGNEGSRGKRRHESGSEGRLSAQSPELGNKHFVVIPRKHVNHYNL